MIYAEAGSSFMQVGGECPRTWIVMSGPRPDGINSTQYTAQLDGSWAITEETARVDAARAENQWRALEMPLAQECVTALSFGDTSIPGTVTQWKGYWLALRDWKEGAEHYPDASHRPVRPT